MKTACASAPSVTVTFATLSVGVSLSVPPAPVPSSRIVPTPASSAMVAFTAPLRATVEGLAALEDRVVEDRHVTVWLITPAAKVSVPLPLG